MNKYRIILVRDTPDEASQVEQYNCSLKNIKEIEKYLSENRWNVTPIKKPTIIKDPKKVVKEFNMHLVDYEV